ncbi:hypothetical protein AMECASPLE_001584, partial [Ameca splendens]
WQTTTKELGKHNNKNKMTHIGYPFRYSLLQSKAHSKAHLTIVAGQEQACHGNSTLRQLQPPSERQGPQKRSVEKQWRHNGAHRVSKISRSL